MSGVVEGSRERRRTGVSRVRASSTARERPSRAGPAPAASQQVDRTRRRPHLVGAGLGLVVVVGGTAATLQTTVAGRIEESPLPGARRMSPHLI